jgi:hypothetical protein
VRGLILLVVGFLAACGGGSAPPEEVPPATPESGGTPPDPYRVEIVLDETAGLGEASLARNFYFILDGSGSMARKPGRACRGDQRFENRLAGAQWAVREFLTKVPEDVHIGLYLFDTRGQREVVPLGGGNRARFLEAVDGIWAGGGTPLAEAIRYGTDRLVEQYKRQLGYGEYRLVVVTDGQADEIPIAATYAGRFGMPIYAIGLCIEEDHPLRRYAVSYRAADDFSDLARGLEETLAELPSFDVTDFDAAELEEP